MISVRTVQGHQQRYPTAGDWYFTGEIMSVRVSKLDNQDFEFLVGLHEMVEAYLCRKRGIGEDVVTRFDKAHPDADEPGDMETCPYRREHQFAGIIERLMANELGVDWYEYEKALGEV